VQPSPDSGGQLPPSLELPRMLLQAVMPIRICRVRTTLVGESGSGIINFRIGNLSFPKRKTVKLCLLKS
jgi:hypothetical protein